jgi:hypothetical protein
MHAPDDDDTDHTAPSTSRRADGTTCGGHKKQTCMKKRDVVVSASGRTASRSRPSVARSCRQQGDGPCMAPPETRRRSVVEHSNMDIGDRSDNREETRRHVLRCLEGPCISPETPLLTSKMQGDLCPPDFSTVSLSQGFVVVHTWLPSTKAGKDT